MIAKRLCIIPARGGSKRIPRKNIKDFLGKPIIAYSIEAAVKSELFDEIMVSTEDQEIADVALYYGAKVPFFRSEKNADDYAITMDVIKEVLFRYKDKNQQFESVCCIYPTAPLITFNKLIEGYNKLIKEKCDAVYPVISFSYPILRGLIIDENENLRMKWPEYYTHRSQDLEQVYHDAGQWYWYSQKSLENDKIETSKAMLLEAMEVQDIDNEEDWRLAEMKFNILNKSNG